jgi:hypothetical protein
MPSLINIIEHVAFIHIPKTGGSTITSALETYIHNTHTRRYEKTNNETDFDAIHATANMIDITHLDKIICVVRNPYDRFVSMFCMGSILGMHIFEPTMKGIMEFCDYFTSTPSCKDMLLFKPMTHFTHVITLSGLKPLANAVLRYEDFENALRNCCMLFNTPIIQSGIINANVYESQTNYNTWYENNSRLTLFVNTVYFSDFKEFNYTMRD